MAMIVTIVVSMDMFYAKLPITNRMFQKFDSAPRKAILITHTQSGAVYILSDSPK